MPVPINMTTSKTKTKTKQARIVDVIEQPDEYDILCGSKRSHGMARHTGNRIFRGKIESQVHAFEQAQTKQERSVINRRIIQGLRQQHGSRFLKQNGPSWVLLSEQAVRDKVSHALRFVAQQRKRQNAHTLPREKEDSTTTRECDGSEDVPPATLYRIYHRQQMILKALKSNESDAYDESITLSIPR